MHAHKALWILVVIVLVSGAFLGGYTVGKIAGATIASTGNSGYDAGYAAAAQKIAESGIIPPESVQVMNVSGTVTAVAANTFTMNANPITANPLAVPGPTVRTVTVDAATTVVKLVALTDAEFKTAMETFNKESAAGKAAVLPVPYREEKSSVGAIQVGATITATAATDVRDAASFSATKIVIAPR